MTWSRPLRQRCELAARLELASVGATEVTVLELSETGAFVEDHQALRELQVGDPAVLLLDVPGGETMAAQCLVARLGSTRRELKHARVDHLTVTTPGFAVVFAAMPEHEKERLRDFIDLLDTR